MINYSEMPVSFSSQAMYSAVHNSYLNTNSKTSWCVKGVKWTGHVAYSVAVGILLAPAGVVYHAAKAVKFNIYSFCQATDDECLHHRNLAWEHMKASAFDIAGIYYCLITAIFTLDPTKKAAEIALELSSECVVKVDDHVDKASDWIKNSLIFPSAYPENASWGVHVYNFRVCQAYRYSDLINHANILKGFYGETLALSDVSVLKSIHIETAKVRRVRYAVLDPQAMDIKLDGKYTPKTTPNYQIPWRSIAYAVASVALIALTGLILVFVIKKFPAQLINATCLWFIPIALAVISAIAIKSRDEYIANRGKAELDCFYANGDKNYKEALFWLRRACLRNYPVAQRIYALSMMANTRGCQDSSFYEGFQWLLTVVNKVSFSSELDKAVDDLSHLSEDANPSNHPSDPNFLQPSKTKEERFVDLFGKTNVQAVCKKRYDASFGKSAQVHLVNKIKHKMLTSILTGMPKANNNSTNPDHVFIPEIADQIASFLY